MTPLVIVRELALPRYTCIKDILEEAIRTPIKDGSLYEIQRAIEHFIQGYMQSIRTYAKLGEDFQVLLSADLYNHRLNFKLAYYTITGQEFLVEHERAMLYGKQPQPSPEG